MSDEAGLSRDLPRMSVVSIPSMLKLLPKTPWELKRKIAKL